MASGVQFRPPRKVTVVDSIIEQFISLIQNGTLKPGDRLPTERELLQMFGVSRSSVREALQGLVAMDLIDVRVGEGTFVKGFKPHLGRDLDLEILSSTLQREMRLHVNQARLMLEREILSLAIEKITEKDQKAIMQALEEYEAHQHLVSEKAGVSAHDRIHLAIAEATGNPILVRILQTLLDLVPKSLRDRGLQFGTPEEVAKRVEREHMIHRHLCEAVVRKDKLAALDWMERHAKAEEDIILTFYGSALEGTREEGAGKLSEI